MHAMLIVNMPQFTRLDALSLSMVISHKFQRSVCSDPRGGSLAMQDSRQNGSQLLNDSTETMRLTIGHAASGQFEIVVKEMAAALCQIVMQQGHGSPVSRPDLLCLARLHLVCTNRHCLRVLSEMPAYC